MLLRVKQERNVLMRVLFMFVIKGMIRETNVVKYPPAGALNRVKICGRVPAKRIQAIVCNWELPG
jgi:hypothetical protein